MKACPSTSVAVAPAAALAAAFRSAVFYPGYLSFDAAEQWRQARAFALNHLHPPLPAPLRHVLDRLWPGSGGMFAGQTLLDWGGLALLAGSAEFRYLEWPVRAALLATVLALAPRLQCADESDRSLQSG